MFLLYNLINSVKFPIHSGMNPFKLLSDKDLFIYLIKKLIIFNYIISYINFLRK